jgi:hypothetical protein
MTIDNRLTGLILLCFMSLACSAQKKEGKMDIKNEVFSKVLNLSPEEYFSIDEQKRMDIGLNKLSEYTFNGMIINAPHDLNIQKNSELPIIIAVSYDALRGWEVDFDRSLIIVATNIMTGEVFIGSGIKTKKRINYKLLNDRGPKPIGDALLVRACGCDIYYLRDLLDLPWKPATYAITCLCWDWVSNTVNVSLFGDTESKHPEDVLKIISPPVNEKNGQSLEKIRFPIYSKINKTPELKTAKLAFELPDEVSLKAKEYPLYGAFKLPVNKNQILPENGKKDALPVVACVQCMFILLKKNQDQSLPWHSVWNLPVYSPKKVVPGDIVEGYFAIDIINNSGPLPEPNTYCAYLVMGDQIVGPRKVIVDAK